MMKILTYPKDKRLLRTPGKPVTLEIIQTSEFKNILKDMMALMTGDDATGDEVGLAAVQVGVSLRFFLLCIDENLNRIEPRVYLNPKIHQCSVGEIKNFEGCLSFPKLFLKINRPRQITWSYQTLDWEDKTETASGFFARAILHETDHCFAKLMIDSIDNVQRTDVLQPWLKTQN